MLVERFTQKVIPGIRHKALFWGQINRYKATILPVYSGLDGWFSPLFLINKWQSKALPWFLVITEVLMTVSETYAAKKADYPWRVSRLKRLQPRVREERWLSTRPSRFRLYFPGSSVVLGLKLSNRCLLGKGFYYYILSCRILPDRTKWFKVMILQCKINGYILRHCN